jgi:hypothetical protein
VVRLLDQAEELLLEVGDQIEICPSYETRAGAKRPLSRRRRSGRRA